MVDFNRIEKSHWDMKNIHDFKKWIDDNKGKTSEGLEAMQAVMSIAPDIASTAAIKWFRESGMQAEEVQEMTGQIVDAILAGCEKKKEEVIRDSASMFAGTGEVALVVMMTFVSYALVGVEVANRLMKNQK